MGESFFSRQWLGFQKGALRLPGLALMQATDWESFNQAVDRFAAPAQAVVYANVDRSFGIRVSGRGIRRKRTGLVPQPAIEGEWLGIEGPEKRFRSWVPADSKTAFLSSANQRLWKAGWGEHWSSDVRDQRIREFLGGPSELDRQQMRALQQDTRSRSMRSLLLWLAKHAVPASASQTALLDSWKKWEGFAEVEEATFAQALLARQLFVRALLSRVRKQFLPTSIQEVRYRWKLENAWQVRIWEASEVEPLAAFGLSSAELATWIVGEVEKKALTQYSVTNRWRKQHPFAHSVPVLGKFFQLEELPQKGFSGVVRTEEPLQGASTRLIWDMDAEDGGEWAFPVGQSGHVFSPFYQNFRKAWFAKSYLPARN
jgi:penicillin amidase